MIYITFYHARDIFKGHEFAPWIKKMFPNGVKFEGTRTGNYYPTISISSIEDFEDAKSIITGKDIIRIRGEFSILEQLIYGVRDFDNSINPKS